MTVDPDMAVYIDRVKIQQLEIPEEIKTEFLEKGYQYVYFNWGGPTLVGELRGIALTTNGDVYYYIVLPHGEAYYLPIRYSITLLQQ
jgi:hypothetical protein